MSNQCQQPYTMFIDDQQFQLELSSELCELDAETGQVKLSGLIPWVGEQDEYFPEDIIGLTLENEAKQEFFVTKAEYDETPCGKRYVKNIWVKPKEQGE